MKAEDLQAIRNRYGIVGNCDALNHVLDVALQVAPTDLSVLVSGESGVGKETIPRIIHDFSPRRREKYFAINCGSIPEGTIDSELFGHVKGSFTGAVADSQGYFGAANRGTLFLDEVGELPPATQARLLRVLETGEYIPVGATDVRKTDVRIVAATNVQLRRAISEGRFREDLYYRLCSIPIQMPPLRERGADIVLLFRLFAMQIAQKYRMEKVQLTDDAKALLTAYKWPGNVRQLKNITEQISILSPERTINAEMLSRFIPQDQPSTGLAVIAKPAGSVAWEEERRLLYKALFEMRASIDELREEVRQMKGQSAPGRLALPSDFADITAIADDEAEVKAEQSKETEQAPTLNIDQVERQMLEKALQRNAGNRKKAASELGISDRTLYRRLKQYGLEALSVIAICLTLTACSVSYKFNGSSIDYSKTKTIQIADFPIRTSYVWGPMASIFNNQLKDIYASHTKLIQVRRNGDLKVEGEITRYEQRNKAVSAEGYSAQTELSMTVNVRFTNNANHSEDFERQFTARSAYETTQSLNSVQEQLVTEMAKEITDQIFNATVANW